MKEGVKKEGGGEEMKAWVEWLGKKGVLQRDELTER
jgi:hypothetical protein